MNNNLSSIDEEGVTIDFLKSFLLPIIVVGVFAAFCIASIPRISAKEKLKPETEMFQYLERR